MVTLWLASADGALNMSNTTIKSLQPVDGIPVWEQRLSCTINMCPCTPPLRSPTDLERKIRVCYLTKENIRKSTLNKIPPDVMFRKKFSSPLCLTLTDTRLVYGALKFTITNTFKEILRKTFSTTINLIVTPSTVLPRLISIVLLLNTKNTS